jgi:hypothetical protein
MSSGGGRRDRASPIAQQLIQGFLVLVPLGAAGSSRHPGRVEICRQAMHGGARQAGALRDLQHRELGFPGREALQDPDHLEQRPPGAPLTYSFVIVMENDLPDLGVKVPSSFPFLDCIRACLGLAA